MTYTHLIAALVGAVIAAKVQGWRMDAQLSQLKTEYATAQAQAVEKAHAETIRLQAQADKAARQHAARASALANDVAGVRTALVSLSDAADGALRAANDTGSACQSNAAALNDVFKSCAGQLRDVATAADGWHSEAMTLREAWPVQSPH